MKMEETAKKLYIKIDFKMRRKKIKRCELAEKIGIKKGYMSDILIDMENGKLPPLKYLIRIQEAIEEELIFFNV
ncbi:hypothetical protein RN96_10525 [Fusobacterium polymorphum]|uniref:HTH cro/C1-type domain-containing protein n=1 Tax=Fusobacterium nucleatum subsp. polymorphum TaxID=76857 RepID=A0A2B7YIA6_FUSNP|nr:hypothetical protein [Fusobacterium polymorphum]PGH20602.1 hypothetical protein RN96_10525 [Fusobacterium polymorphum]